MTRKILYSLLGAGLAFSLAAPVAAQPHRGERQHADSDYSRTDSQRDETRGERHDDRRDDRYDDRYDERFDDRYDNRRTVRRYDRRQDRRAARTVTIPTRYRATIFVTEDVVYSRRGPRNVCTVSVRGPEQRYVPKRRLRQVARNNCSRRAVINIRA